MSLKQDHTEDLAEINLRMQISPHVKISIPSELGYEIVPVAAAESLAQKMGFSIERCEVIKTVTFNAVIDAIERSNADFQVDIIFYLLTEALVFKVIDRGPPIPDLPQIEIDYKKALAERINVFNVWTLADKVAISTELERNEVQLVFYLEQ
jgi:hypothetical protein